MMRELQYPSATNMSPLFDTATYDHNTSKTEREHFKTENIAE